MDCLFCKIINGDVPCFKIYEDDVVISFLDINPQTNGHTLIIPKKHYLDMDDIDIETINHIFEVAKKIKKLLEEKLNIDGLTLVQNNGLSEEIKHYHLHLIPNYKENQQLLSIEDIYIKIKD